MHRESSPTSARRKLARGIEQVKALCAEAEAFEDDEAYTFRKEIETSTPEYVRYRCFATQRQPVPDHWPLLAGEAVHNLRGALDHVVYASVKRPHNKLQFPIFTDECEFRVIGKPMLRGVPEAMRTLIERAQPYVRAPQAPKRESLELLRTFSNIDKHRNLATVAASVQREHVGIYPVDIRVGWEKYATNVPLGEGDTHISTFVAVPDSPEVKVEEMQVTPGFSYEVRIEGRPLRAVVRGIAKRVFEVVTECETGEPISPFATYPI